MANNNSRAGGLGKGVLGVGVGFALYFLIRNFRLGGGFGLGGGRGEAPGEGPPQPQAPAPAEPLPVPRDEQPLLYVVVHPDGFKEASKLSDPTSRARTDAAFRPIDLGTAELSVDEMHRRAGDVLRRERDKGVPPLSIDDVIARIKAGGRDDARLISQGNLRSGTWDDVVDTLMAAGIKHWILKQDLYQPHEKPYPGYVWKPPWWDLNDKMIGVGNPDKAGHYLFESRGSAYWNLARSAKAPPPHVSGNARGQYGRGYRSADRIALAEYLRRMPGLVSHGVVLQTESPRAEWAYEVRWLRGQPMPRLPTMMDGYPVKLVIVDSYPVAYARGSYE